jgi:hypothetical protein
MMANPAARQGEEADGNALHLQPASGVAPRGSADSFRELLARLKKSNDQTQAELTGPADQPKPAHVPEAHPVETPPAAIVIQPKAAWLAPEPPPQPSVEAVVVEPPPPAPPQIDAREQERRARMRAEAHAASQEIIARLRKAAGQSVEKQPAPEPVAELPKAEVPAVPDAPVADLVEQVENLVGVSEPLPEPEPVAIADGSAVSEAPKPVAGRRRHPFFPDVFLDDEGEAAETPAPAVPDIAVPAASEAPMLEVAEPAAAEPEPVFAESAPLAEPEPAAELPAPALWQTEAPTALEATPPIIEPEAPEPEAPELGSPEPDAIPPEPFAEAPAAGTEDEDGHQEELIEDEADAVRHLRGIEVKGIGDIAKSIFSAPTPAERAEFLAEVKKASAGEPEPAEVMAADEATLVASAASVRRIAPADDPFAKIAPDETTHVNHDEPDEDSGELARSLLDMMLSSPSAGLPQERALAADALLKLIPKVPTKALIAIAERLSLMDSPPNLLIARLINDPRIEISGPLLEQCNHISDQVLGKVVATGQISLQRLIARRRHLSAALTDQIIEFDDASVLLTLVRNSGAVISHSAFNKLMHHAKSHHDTLAPLATRSDLPPTVAFELFWFVPAELRRYLLSRFLTDSETLTKILKITKVMQGGEGTDSQFADKAAIEDFMAVLTEGRRDDAVLRLAAISGISAECAARIVGDRQGEPLAIVFKAIGLTRAQFEDCIVKLQQPAVGIISPDRVVQELQSTFNSMSFNKARILLTYWDWAVQKHGPYAEAQ